MMLTRARLQHIGLALLMGLSLTDIAAQTAPDMTRAEVKKIDKATQRITLKHETIQSLDMPPMTMVFKVQDPALLDKAKAGDKVKVHIERREASLVVTTLEADQ